MAQILTKEVFEKRLLEIEENESIGLLEDWCKDFAAFCPAYTLAVMVVELATSWNDNGVLDANVVRSVFETVLGACGMDVIGASDLWNKYLEFEINEHEDFLEESGSNISSEQLKKSKERFMKVVERQLSLPLVGNEKTLQLLEKLLEQYCTESDITIIKPDQLQRKFQSAIAMREERLTFEIFIHSEQYTNAAVGDKIQAWLTYIDFEIKAKQFPRVQRLYERVLLEADCASSDISVWLKYAVFVLCTLKNCVLAESILQRALQYHPTSLWSRKLMYLALEGNWITSTNLVDIHGIVAKLQVILQEGLSWGFNDTYSYLYLYLAHSNSVRRIFLRIVPLLTEESDFLPILEQLNSILTTLQLSFTQYFAQWAEGLSMLCKLHSYILLQVTCFQEAYFLSSTEKINKEKPHSLQTTQMIWQQWDTVTKMHPKQFWLWREAIASISLQATHFPPSSCLSSSAASVSHWQTRVTSVFKRVWNELHHNNNVEQKWMDVSSAAEIAGEWLRFEDQYGEVTGMQSLFDCIDRVKEAIFAVECNAPAKTVSASTVVTETKTSSTAKKSNKRPREVDATEEEQVSRRSKDEFKEGKDENEEEAEDKIVKKKMRGIGVTFLEQQQQSSAEKDSVPAINTDISNADTTGTDKKTRDTNSSGSQDHGHDTADKNSHSLSAEDTQRMKRTVFISRLPLDVDDDRLRQIFEHCGPMVDLRVARDKRSGVSKGSALIEFADEKGVVEALRLHKTDIANDGKDEKISVGRSKFLLQPLPASRTAAAAPENPYLPRRPHYQEHHFVRNTKENDGVEKEKEAPTTENTSIVNKPKLPIATSSTITSFKPRGVMNAKKPKLQL